MTLRFLIVASLKFVKKIASCLLAKSSAKLHSLNANISSGQSKNSKIFLSKNVLMKTSARLWQVHSQPDILGEGKSES